MIICTCCRSRAFSCGAGEAARLHQLCEYAEPRSLNAPLLLHSPSQHSLNGLIGHIFSYQWKCSMAWIYRQASHPLLHDGKLATSQGYAGKIPCKNRPDCQSMADKGPLPRGSYAILAPRTHRQTGAWTLPLLPAPSNQMFGRKGFLIHGASQAHPNDSSTGCIVLPIEVRQRIWASGDH